MMNDIKLPFFDNINLDQVEEYYSIDNIEIGNTKLQIDLNFKNTKIDVTIAYKLKEFLENLNEYRLLARTYVNTDFNNEDGQVKEFIHFHLDELGEVLLNKLQIESDASNKEMLALEKLQLVRLGFYPDAKYNATYFCVFDFKIDNELSDQIIAVKTNENGELDHIAWES